MGFHGRTPWNKGTKGACKPNSGSFRPGHRPWSAGKAGTGVMKRNRGSFGGPIHSGGGRIEPLGTRRWRGHPHHEVFVKVSMSPSDDWAPRESRGPNSGQWKPLHVVDWEAVHGPLPRGALLRRLLPLCTCEFNLVLIDHRVNGLLNRGTWIRPARPWRTLPVDAELRFSAVLAAVAMAEAAAGRDREILRRRGAGATVTAIARGLDTPKSVVSRVLKKGGGV